MKKQFLYIFALILTLHTTKNLTLPKPYDIEIRFDTEGRNPFSSFLEHSQALKKDETTGKITLIPGRKWLHIGDMPDHGPHMLEIINGAIALKESDPDNVILIAGNRELNKITIYAETENDALDLQGEDRFAINKFRKPDWQKKFDQWLADKKNVINGKVVAYQHGKSPESDRVLKLKWILECTKGAPKAFEYFKQETGITDDYEATKAYRDLCKKDGLFHRLLSLMQPIHIEENTDTQLHPGTIFTHGGFCPENWGCIPLQGQKPVRLAMTEKSDLYLWRNLLSESIQQSIQAAFNGDLQAGLLAVEYCEPKNINGKEELNKESVVQGVRPWVESLTDDEKQRLADPETPAEEKEMLSWKQRNLNNARPIDDAITAQLRSWNLTIGVFGHTPVEELPLIIRRNGFTTIWGDLSYSRLKELTALRICNGQITAITPYQDSVKKTTLITSSTANANIPVIGRVTINEKGRDVFTLGRKPDGTLLQQTFDKVPGDSRIKGLYKDYQKPNMH